MHWFCCVLLIYLLTAQADECSRAAEIYECGRQKAPAVTDAIQNQLTSDRSVLVNVCQLTWLDIFVAKEFTKYCFQAEVIYPNRETEQRYCRTRDLPCIFDVKILYFGWMIIILLIIRSNSRYFKSSWTTRAQVISRNPPHKVFSTPFFSCQLRWARGI